HEDDRSAVEILAELHFRARMVFERGIERERRAELLLDAGAVEFLGPEVGATGREVMPGRRPGGEQARQQDGDHFWPSFFFCAASTTLRIASSIGGCHLPAASVQPVRRAASSWARCAKA